MVLPEIPATVVLAGIPLPVIAIPGNTPAVEDARVRLPLPLVVVAVIETTELMMEASMVAFVAVALAVKVILVFETKDAMRAP